MSELQQGTFKYWSQTWDAARPKTRSGNSHLRLWLYTHVEPTFGRVEDVSQISSSDIQDWRRSLEATGLGPTIISGSNNVLRQILQLAARGRVFDVRSTDDARQRGSWSGVGHPETPSAEQQVPEADSDPCRVLIQNHLAGVLASRRDPEYAGDIASFANERGEDYAELLALQLSTGGAVIAALAEIATVLGSLDASRLEAATTAVALGWIAAANSLEVGEPDALVIRHGVAQLNTWIASGVDWEDADEVIDSLVATNQLANAAYEWKAVRGTDRESAWWQTNEDVLAACLVIGD